jgi:D-glycero-D-manno-heptose 1,7-bisphosphate phosphatase
MLEKLRDALAVFAQKKVDGLVITGDIVDVPRWMWKEGFYYDNIDLSYWEQMVYLEYLSLHALFKEQPYPIWTIPGNHDHPALYRKVFGRHLEPSTLQDFSIYSFSDWGYRASIPRRIDKERTLFDQALKEGPHKQIHLQHYIVAPKVEHPYPYNYMEWEFLKQEIVQSQKVSLCLSGHFHKGAQAKIGCTHFHTVRAFAEAPHPYAIYHILEDKAGNAHTSDISIEVEHGQMLHNPPKQKALFLDRDGCLTQEPAFYGGPGDLVLLPGTAKALQHFKSQGYMLVVVSNQSCIGQGYATEDTVNWTHDALCKELQEQGAYVDGFYFSKGVEAGSQQRAVHPKFLGDEDVKPSPNLLHKAAQELHIDLAQSYMVGDRLTDVECGLTAGCTPILVRTGYGSTTEAELPQEIQGAVQVVDSLGEWKP